MDAPASIPDDGGMTLNPTEGAVMQSIKIGGTEYRMSDESFDLLIENAAREERERGLANAPRCDRTKWCECAELQSDPDDRSARDAMYERVSDESSYYATVDHRHGWFHDPALGGCGGITQTG